MFEKMCSVLGATHHITLPHHPEGHALIEREFRDINAMIRALATKGYDDWPDHIGAIQFALNTAYSRALGTSPFEALHGFAPRTLLANAVDADPVDPEDPALADPQELGARLVTRATRLRVQVEELRKKIHESNAHRWRRKAQGSANFRCGSYVLLRTTLKDKTQVRWTGPYVVVRRAEGVENAYVITDLAHQREQTQAAANLHAFRRGRLTDAQLLAESASPGEYFVDRVRDHYIADDKAIVFLVDWTGYPPSDPAKDDSWVTFADAHWAPPVKAYIRAHRLEAAVRARNRALGAPPRS